jgi:isorenieratene synthase
VETHATPIAPGRSAVIETTLATSDRPGFAVALRAARFIRPLIERAAARLWVEDIAYAERRRAVAARSQPAGPRAVRHG